MYSISRKSGWSFETSGGMSVGASFAGMGQAGGSVAHFILKTPGGQFVRFDYVSAGVGIGGGKTIGPMSGGLSLEAMPSEGEIWILDTFGPGELDVDDITGFAMITEGSISVMGVSYTGTMMVLGTPLSRIPQELMKEGGALQMALGLAAQHPTLTKVAGGFFGGMLVDDVAPSLRSALRSEAKAGLVMFGWGVVNGMSAGLLGSYGIVTSKATPLLYLPMPEPPTQEIVEIKTNNSAKEGWVRLRLQGDVLFDFAKWDIKPECEPLLRLLGERIRQKAPRVVQFNGYTDSIGYWGPNKVLSEQRAKAVSGWLAAHGLLKGYVVENIGHSMDDPVQPNTMTNGKDNAIGRAMNRRVEVALFA